MCINVLNVRTVLQMMDDYLEKERERKIVRTHADEMNALISIVFVYVSTSNSTICKDEKPIENCILI